MLDQLVVVRSRMKLGTIISAGEGESAYNVWISGHMDLDELRWGWDSVLVGDGEWDEVFPNVVDESLRRFDRYCCMSWCCASISRGGRWLY